MPAQRPAEQPAHRVRHQNDLRRPVIVVVEAQLRSRQNSQAPVGFA
jgi:hypothetical protein